MNPFKKLLQNESGAVIADWIVASGAIAGIAGASIYAVSQGAQNVAGDVETALNGMDPASITASLTSADGVDTGNYEPVEKPSNANGELEVSAPQFPTQLDSASYASYDGLDDGSGGTITAQSTDDLIDSLNSEQTQALLDDYAGYYMLEVPNNSQQLALEIAEDLLQERGISDPWLEAALYNTDPTKLTAEDLAFLYTGSDPVATQAEVQAALDTLDTLHSVQLLDQYTNGFKSELDQAVAQALVQERELV